MSIVQSELTFTISKVIYMRNIHNTKTRPNLKSARFSCPATDCTMKYFHCTQLINHLAEHKMDVGKTYAQDYIKIIMHNFVVTENLKFPDWKSFLEWKEKEETLTYTSYVKPKGSQTDGNNVNANIICTCALVHCSQNPAVHYCTCCRDDAAKENKQPKATENTRKHRGSVVCYLSMMEFHRLQSKSLTMSHYPNYKTHLNYHPSPSPHTNNPNSHS